MPDSQATARFAAAVGQILPVDGERSLTAVGATFELEISPADDAAEYAGQLIAAAGEAGALEDVVRALVTESVMYRRDAREPIDTAEYAELAAAAAALGVTVPASAEVDDASAEDDATERRSRLLGAMLDLYSDMMSGAEDERPLKLANVLGGLLRANDVEILRLPQARATRRAWRRTHGQHRAPADGGVGSRRRPAGDRYDGGVRPCAGSAHADRGAAGLSA